MILDTVNTAVNITVLSLTSINTLVCRGGRKYMYPTMLKFRRIMKKIKQEREVGIGRRVTLFNKVVRKTSLMRGHLRGTGENGEGYVRWMKRHEVRPGGGKALGLFQGQQGGGSGWSRQSQAPAAGHPV